MIYKSMKKASLMCLVYFRKSETFDLIYFKDKGKVLSPIFHALITLSARLMNIPGHGV